MNGKKFDSDKMPAVQGLINYFPRALLAVAKQSKYGAEKYEVPYSDQNWAKLDGAKERYNDARGRHIIDEAVDGLYDSESHTLHAAAAAWNALAYLELLLREGTPSVGSTTSSLLTDAFFEGRTPKVPECKAPRDKPYKYSTEVIQGTSKGLYPPGYWENFGCKGEDK